MGEWRAPAAPNVDSEEKEEPDYVHEMPVPGSRFETEMLLGCEITLECAEQADQQEDRSDQHVEAMEAGRHEEGRTIDRVMESEWSVRIFVRLN